jgi:hypothetical protein
VELIKELEKLSRTNQVLTAVMILELVDRLESLSSVLDDFREETCSDSDLKSLFTTLKTRAQYCLNTYGAEVPIEKVKK